MTTIKKTYVPPSKRAEVPKINDLSMNELNDTKLFPSLSEGPSPTNNWKGTTSFKQTIYNLIASEKMTQQERAIAEEKRLAMDGWASIPLKPTPEILERRYALTKILEDNRKKREAAEYGYYESNDEPNTRFGNDYFNTINYNIDIADYIPEPHDDYQEEEDDEAYE